MPSPKSRKGSNTSRRLRLPRFLYALLICLLFPAPASAEWTTGLSSHTPEYFLAADKSRKLLFQVERRKADPVVTRTFDCIHGRREGDKQKEGDLRTPEGVYFVTHKIEQKLDFMEYGPHAFNLNYPNPADRLRGKTGGGIWLHSKGQPIEGLTTRGCMAIDMYEIEDLVPLLIPGTPVIIAEHLQGAPFETPPEGTAAQGLLPSLPGGTTVFHSAESPADVCPPPGKTSEQNICPPLSATPAPDTRALLSAEETVRCKTLLWMERRLGRTDDILELYDRKKFPRGNREKISSLRKRLRSEFQLQHDVFLDREGIRILEGPGYWVSCFIKSYERKGVLHHGLQALYWMPDDKGDCLIIGEVWISN